MGDDQFARTYVAGVSPSREDDIRPTGHIRETLHDSGEAHNRGVAEHNRLAGRVVRPDTGTSVIPHLKTVDVPANRTVYLQHDDIDG